MNNVDDKVTIVYDHLYIAFIAMKYACEALKQVTDDKSLTDDFRKCLHNVDVINTEFDGYVEECRNGD